MTVFELLAKISLDTTEYDKGLDLVKSGASKIAGLGATAFAAATAAVGAFGLASVKTGMGFDSAMSQVAATMGKTVDEMMGETASVELSWGNFTGNLRDYAQEMGAHTAFSATQAAEALNYMALAGYDTEKSMKTLPNVLNLAAAGAMDLASASDMVTDAETALGIANQTTEDGIPRTTVLIDEMARTASKTNTSVSQLGSAILTIGGTAKILKGGMVELADGTEMAYDGTTELSTALGLLADNGIKGSAAGTSLRNILSSLSGGKFDKTFGELGVSAYDANGQMRSLKDILADMNEVMDGMTDQEKTNLINSVFNQRDLKSINALLATTGDRWDEITVALLNSEGAASEMAETQLDNLAGDITLFQSAVEGAQIALSDKLTPSLRDFVKEGTEGVSRFSEMIKSGDIPGAMGAIGESLGKMAGNAVAQLPQLIAAGGALINGLVVGMGKAVSQIDFTHVVVPMLVGFSGNIRSKAKELVGVGVELIRGIGNGISGGLGELETPVSTILTNIVGVITDNAPVLFEAGLELLTKLGEGIGENLPGFLENTVLPMMLNISESIREGAGKLVDCGIDFILNLAQGIMDSLPTLLEQLPQIVINIAGVINDNAPKLIMGGVQLISMIINGIVQAVPTLIANFPKIFEAIFSVWTAFNWLNLGKHVITTIKTGIENLQVQIPLKLQELGQRAIDWFKGVNWTSAGQHAINFIKAAINGLFSAIPELLKSIGSSAIELFKGVNWANAGTMAITFILGALSTMFVKIPNKLKEIGEEAWDSFKNIDWYSLGDNLISGIANGISDGIGWLKEKARSAAQSAYDAAANLLEIKSPSRKARRGIGQMFSRGLALGITDYAKEVEDAAEDVVDKMMKPASVVTDFKVGEVQTPDTGIVADLTAAMNANNEAMINGLYLAMSAALQSADLRVQIGNREFARILREAGAL